MVKLRLVAYSIIAFLLLIGLVGATWIRGIDYTTVYNPWTAKNDYVLNVNQSPSNITFLSTYYNKSEVDSRIAAINVSGGNGTGNTSWNETYARTLFATNATIPDNTSWKESLARTLYATNATIPDNTTWNEALARTLFATNVTIPDNTSWNEALARTLYATNSTRPDNTTWNETLARTLFAVTNTSYFFNKTYQSYTAAFSAYGLTGYTAGNAICNKNFTGSHLCSWTEVVRTYDISNVSNLPDWTGTAWIAGGPSKYTGIGVLFVNDCHGFTDASGADSYGNAWDFTNNKGLTGNCGSIIPIACCKG